MVQLYEMNVELPQDYLLAIANMVVSFGRLEGAVKLAIKNLAVSLKISANFMEGLREAEMRRQFGCMCDHMLKLYRQKYGECKEGTELAEFVEYLKGLAEHRNHFVHGQWTINRGKVIVLHSKWTKKAGLRSTGDMVPIEALHNLNDMVVKSWLALQTARKEWAE
jgi:hypothetical protein